MGLFVIIGVGHVGAELVVERLQVDGLIVVHLVAEQQHIEVVLPVGVLHGGLKRVGIQRAAGGAHLNGDNPLGCVDRGDGVHPLRVGLCGRLVNDLADIIGVEGQGVGDIDIVNTLLRMLAQTGTGKHIAGVTIFPGFFHRSRHIDGGLHLRWVEFQCPVRQLYRERQCAIGFADRRLQRLGGLFLRHAAQILIHHIDIGQNRVVAGHHGGIAKCAAGCDEQNGCNTDQADGGPAPR